MVAIRKNHLPTMEINQKIRRQYVITLDEEEAQDIRLFLDGLQDRDYEAPFERVGVSDPAKQTSIRRAFKDLHQSLELVPAARSGDGTRHS